MRSNGFSIGQRAKQLALFVLFRSKRSLDRLGVTRIPAVISTLEFFKRKFISGGTMLITSNDGLMYVDIRDEVIAPSLLARVREEFEMELFKDLAKPGMVVLDVGANIGSYTIAAARLVGQEGKVYAFEPEPRNFELLQKNLEINHLSNVQAVQKAVSDRDGQRLLFVSRYNLGSHSFAGDNTPDWRGRVQAETIALDGFIERELAGRRVDLMKVDTQGAEVMILDGAAGMIAGSDVTIVMECWPFGLNSMGYSVADLLERLASLGLTIRIIDETERRLKELDGRSIAELCGETGDYGRHLSLFLRKEAACSGGGG